MPDPYAARGVPRRPSAVETKDERTTLLDRLRELGADDAELAQVTEGWDELDADDCDDPDCWTAAKRSALVRAGDNELVALLHRARSEYETGTHDEAEQAVLDFRRAVDAAKAEANDRLAGNVDSILAWVGDDPVRAAAVYELEHASGSPRKTLVEPIGAMLDAAAPSTDEEPELGRIGVLLLGAGCDVDDADEGEVLMLEARNVIGAVFGAELDDVEDAIYAALVGEGELIRAYGIDLPPVTNPDVTPLDLVTARHDVIVQAAQALRSALPDPQTNETPSDAPEAASGDESPGSGGDS